MMKTEEDHTSCQHQMLALADGKESMGRYPGIGKELPVHAANAMPHCAHSISTLPIGRDHGPMPTHVAEVHYAQHQLITPIGRDPHLMPPLEAPNPRPMPHAFLSLA